MVKQSEWAEICKLLEAGLSVSQISIRVGRSPTTIYRLLNKGGPKKRGRKYTVPKKLRGLENYLDQRIKERVTNAKKLFLELKQLGYQGSYSSLNRYLNQRKNFKADKPSLRFETKPGEQAQVDWGSFGKIEINGKLERLYCFVYVLGYSRAMYVEFVIKQNLQTFESCHIHAFGRLGIPKLILYDNIKTVVLRRERLPNKRQRIHYNPAFLDFAQYYGFQVRLCKPYWPRTKGKVEAGIKYVRNNFMQGMKFNKGFTSLEELNKRAKDWLDNVANKRIHGTTEEKPVKRWLKEKPYLKLAKDFPVYETSPFLARNSTKDGLVQYKSNFYSVPAEFSRKKLLVKEVNENGVVSIKIYHEDKVIATHLLSLGRGEWIVNDHHLVSEKPSYSKRRKTRADFTKGTKKKKAEKRLFIPARPLSYYDQLISKNKDG